MGRGESGDRASFSTDKTSTVPNRPVNTSCQHRPLSKHTHSHTFSLSLSTSFFCCLFPFSSTFLFSLPRSLARSPHHSLSSFLSLNLQGTVFVSWLGFTALSLSLALSNFLSLSSVCVVSVRICRCVLMKSSPRPIQLPWAQVSLQLSLSWTESSALQDQHKAGGLRQFPMCWIN